MKKSEKVERMLTLSVVMPAYNEEATLAEIVHKILDVPGLLELIIVDDCSTDRTGEIADELTLVDDRIKYIRQERNQGKTAALVAGFVQTRGDVVIIQDADLEYDPTEIPGVVYPIQAGFADVVYGSRFMIRRAARVLYFYHYLANKGLTFLSNLLTNLNLSDVETCYKAFRGEIIRNIRIDSVGFGFEIEVTAKIAKLKCVVYEVPISYYGRTYDEGKKIGMRDGVAAFWYVIKYNLFCSLNSSYKKLPQLRSSRLDLPPLADTNES
ncbi:MAG: glycosyltransferase family 2 protein [Pyrinomonadaceae bacterium]